MTPAQTLDATLRAHHGRIMAALIARVGEFSLAEEALQDAAASALIHWDRIGTPDRPVSWLIRVAFRKAIDRLRKSARGKETAAALTVLSRDEGADDPEAIPDERLRLIFTCCHPALEPKTRVALTLRLLCGLTTAQIASAFLDEDTTMGQRLSRAKAKIATAGIPFSVPEPDAWAERVNSLLIVVFLVFTTGYTAGPSVGRDLCEEAVFLARMLSSLAPEDAEVEGLLALVLLTHARAGARINAQGISVALNDQDRRLWNHGMIAEGLTILDQAVARGRPGPFQIKAAISALHVQAGAGGADWRQIVLLYDSLLRFEDSEVVRLNRAVALAQAGGPTAALAELRGMSVELDGYQPYHAALADLEARHGDTNRALTAYLRAIELATSPADQAFLRQQAAIIKKKAETSSAKVQQGGKGASVTRQSP